LNFNLYSIDDLIEIKTKIEEIKRQIQLPSKQDKHREKKIYGQIVRLLGENIKYEDGEESSKTRLEDRNLLGLIRGVAVCQGFAEIVRNLSAEYGIQAISVRGTFPENGTKQSHEWNQVRLDSKWYDDDFTNYRKGLVGGNLDSCYCFLMGATSEGMARTKLAGYETSRELMVVNGKLSMADKKFLLEFGREKQRTVQEAEKVRPKEESISDEVGDDAVAKTLDTGETTATTQTMWQDRFKTWDETVDKMQDGAKKKQEAVKLIQDLEQDRKKDKQEQLQANQSSEQR